MIFCIADALPISKPQFFIGESRLSGGESPTAEEESSTNGGTSGARAAEAGEDQGDSISRHKKDKKKKVCFFTLFITLFYGTVIN